MTSDERDAAPRVWDLPTRMFHWTLVLGVLVACASAHAEGEAALRLHFLSGYAVLGLVVFRLLWGFAGTRYARFAQFVRGPLALRRYLREPAPAAATAGHNPLGGWSVLALLATCLLMAGSGLFTRDEIASEGPLAQLVAERAVGLAGRLHANGELLLYLLVGLHLAAIAYFEFVRRERLVRAMLDGRQAKRRPAPASDGELPFGTSAALPLLLLAVALVAYLAYIGA